VRPGEEVSGAVLVQNGRIVAVGPGVSAPEGARTIEGEVVCAGYLDAWSTLGVIEDTAQAGKLDAASRAVDGLDPYGQEVERLESLRAGVTFLRVQAGVEADIGGRCAVVRNDPDASVDDLALLDDACVTAAIGVTASNRVPDVFTRVSDVDKLVREIEGGRSYRERETDYEEKLAEWEKGIAEKEEELEKDFKKAKKKREEEMEKAEEKGKKFKESRYREDRKPKKPRFDPEKEVMARVESGEIPLVVEVHRAPEMRELLDKTAAFDRLRLILAGATEAETLAGELARREIPVIVWPVPMGAGRPDEYKAHDLELAGKLDEAGVEVLFGSGGETSARDLSALAALAVGHGLEPTAALDALTLGPARSFDVADRIGSVERGKEADLLVLSGDPLDVTTRPTHVILRGNVVVEP
jgi:imidazolonepropionase-like amidohydrolase